MQTGFLFDIEKSTCVSQQSPWTNQKQSPHLLMLFPTNETNGPKDLPGVKMIWGRMSTTNILI